jgi:hypothetical protein
VLAESGQHTLRAQIQPENQKTLIDLFDLALSVIKQSV